MRKLFALILALMILLPVLPAPAEEETAVEPKPTTDPEVWVKTVVRQGDPFDFTALSYDELPPVVDGQHHYLLLCLDEWDISARPDGIDVPHYSESNGGGRKNNFGNTDGICLLTLDTRAHRVMLTSITRDTLVLKVNLGDDTNKVGRINNVYNDYGPEALCQIISQHLGVRIEKYIMFTFRQVANIVDYMGGVQLELTKEEIKHLKPDVQPGTLTDPNGKDITLDTRHPEGVYTFKTTSAVDPSKRNSTGGCSAVLYMRIRKDAAVDGVSGDFMRTQRARNVLSALADKCRVMTWDDVQALVNNILENNNKTNMNLNEMLQAAEYAFGLQNCTIEEFRIPTDSTKRSHHHANMATWEVNWGRVRELYAEYLETSFLVADDEDEEDD